MQSLHNEIQNANDVDWKKVKEIICGIEASLKLICDTIPSGIIKSVICGIAGVLALICKSIPSE